MKLQERVDEALKDAAANGYAELASMSPHDVAVDLCTYCPDLEDEDVLEVMRCVARSYTPEPREPPTPPPSKVRLIMLVFVLFTAALILLDRSGTIPDVFWAYWLGALSFLCAALATVLALWGTLK